MIDYLNPSRVYANPPAESAQNCTTNCKKSAPSGDCMRIHEIPGVETFIRKSKLTAEQIALLKALKVLGFKWITRRNHKDFCCAFSQKPARRDCEGDWYSFGGESVHVHDEFKIFFPLGYAEKPINIEEALKDAEEADNG